MLIHRRLSRRTVWGKALAWIFAGVLWAAAGGHSALASEEKQALNQVKKQLNAVNKNLTAAKTEHGKTLDSLQRIERNIAERSLKQQQTRDKLSVLEQQSAALMIKKNQLNAAYLTSLDALKSLLVTRYKMGRQSGLKRLLSQQDPAQISRFAQYANYVADARRRLIVQTQSLADKTAAAETELNGRSLQLAKLNLLLENDQAYLTQLKQNRLRTLDALDGEIADQSSKAQKLADKEARLTQLMNDLAAQNASAPKKVIAKIATTAAIGTLPLPVKATLVAKFGQKRSETGIPWSGILLKGEAGAQIRAIADGKVVYADWLSGYGQLIIIDHGNDLMSLYGHNRSLNKTVGDKVGQHELISYMGDTAGLRSAALYFEIRHHGKPQDPLKWCSA